MNATHSMDHSLKVTPTARLLGLESFNAENLHTAPNDRGVFGGQVIGQALMAASKTVEGKDLHSQHCYFLMPCNSRQKVTYAVERLRDGKGYATRLVHAIQNSETIFTLMASFAAPPVQIPAETTAKVTGKAPAPGAVPFATRFQRELPAGLQSFAEANTDEARWSHFVSTMGDFGVAVTDDMRPAFLEQIRKDRPMHTSSGWQQVGENKARRALWFKPTLEGKMEPNEIRAMIGYMTDAETVVSLSRTIGLSAVSDPRLGMVATIDHAIHYYPFPTGYDGTQPVVHILETDLVDLSSGRGFVNGRVYTEDGVLIASTSQEGVVRSQVRGKKPRQESKL